MTGAAFVATGAVTGIPGVVRFGAATLVAAAAVGAALEVFGLRLSVDAVLCEDEDTDALCAPATLAELPDAAASAARDSAALALGLPVGIFPFTLPGCADEAPAVSAALLVAPAADVEFCVVPELASTGCALGLEACAAFGFAGVLFELLEAWLCAAVPLLAFLSAAVVFAAGVGTEVGAGIGCGEAATGLAAGDTAGGICCCMASAKLAGALALAEKLCAGAGAAAAGVAGSAISGSACKELSLSAKEFAVAMPEWPSLSWKWINCCLEIVRSPNFNCVGCRCVLPARLAASAFGFDLEPTVGLGLLAAIQFGALNGALALDQPLHLTQFFAPLLIRFRQWRDALGLLHAPLLQLHSTPTGKLQRGLSQQPVAITTVGRRGSHTRALRPGRARVRYKTLR